MFALLYENTNLIVNIFQSAFIAGVIGAFSLLIASSGCIKRRTMWIRDAFKNNGSDALSNVGNSDEGEQSSAFSSENAALSSYPLRKQV